jgi:hypothetical protein
MGKGRSGRLGEPAASTRIRHANPEASYTADLAKGEEWLSHFEKFL